ncbi:MAG: CCA tRNA nucleotidyltransferase [Candidatus Marsarchaeota archaeon]|nr:CCA tRNA nucleotidyltransferase [Candidatus Marsarchaeota archaeon]
MTNSNKKPEVIFSKGASSKLKKLLHEVLIDVRPTPKEIAAMTAASNDIMGRLKRVAPKDVEIMLLGSISRGTQIRGSSDIDIFLLFPKSMDERKMEELGLRIAKKIVEKGESYEIKYAEHPYLKLKLSGINATADIVPAFKISSAEEMGSAVDRTQLHNEFVNRVLSQKQRNDVRILKAFLNAHNIYGAEARTEGFSGYMCELLVYHYGSFIGVLEGIANLKLPLIIDVNKHSKIPSVAESVKRFGSEFIVIDPTDHMRNVAANVSRESLGRFVLHSREFLRKPCRTAFYGRGYSNVDAGAHLKKLCRDLNLNLYVMALKLPDIAEDVLWQQLSRLRGGLLEELKHNNLAPAMSFQNIAGRDAILAFFACKAETPYSFAKGPSALMGSAADAFLKSHRKSLAIMLDGERLAALERSKFSNAGALLKSKMSGKDINLPSYMTMRGAKLYTNDIPEHYAKMLYEAMQEKSLLL